MQALQAIRWGLRHIGCGFLVEMVWWLLGACSSEGGNLWFDVVVEKVMVFG